MPKRKSTRRRRSYPARRSYRRRSRIGGIGSFKALALGTGMLAVAKILMKKYAPFNLGAYTTGVSMLGAGAVSKVANIEKPTGDAFFKVGIMETGSEAISNFVLPLIMGGFTTKNGGSTDL